MLETYRDPKLARKLTRKINDLAEGLPDDLLLVHMCGTHEWTITHSGIRTLLPNNVELRAGPGCPVCVTPVADIDAAVKLTIEGKTVLTYGDMSKVRSSDGVSLLDTKAEGGDVRIVYGVHDAVQMAAKEPGREFVFFGVGFDTTAPMTAYEILKGPPKNISFLIAYRYVPTLAGAVLESPLMGIDGLINAGHSATITGMKPYYPYFLETRIPQVFCGFEPIDVLIGIAMLLKQMKDKRPKLENEYTRSVTWEGNIAAQTQMDKVFNLVEGYARGVAVLPEFGFEVKEEFSMHDARKRYGITERSGHEQFALGVRCGEVILGLIDPPECPLYMKGCTPLKPKGPMMVSAEGTCKIWADHKLLQPTKCRI